MSHATSSAASSKADMSLIGHLRELRTRLIRVLLALVVATGACMPFAEELFAGLRLPLARLAAHQMVVLSPLELFITYVKVALVAGVFLSMPILLGQFWGFVSPGLLARERRLVLPFVFFGSGFFLLGGAFAFWVVMPAGFGFLIGMVPAEIQATYSVAIYFGLVLRLLLAFGFVFELPLLMWLLAASGLVQARQMQNARKYWFVAAVVLGAVLTPPDPLTQLMMATPLVLFFELGILGALWIGKRQQKRGIKDAEEDL